VCVTDVLTISICFPISALALVTVSAFDARITEVGLLVDPYTNYGFVPLDPTNWDELVVKVANSVLSNLVTVHPYETVDGCFPRANVSPFIVAIAETSAALASDFHPLTTFVTNSPDLALVISTAFVLTIASAFNETSQPSASPVDTQNLLFEFFLSASVLPNTLC